MISVAITETQTEHKHRRSETQTEHKHRRSETQTEHKHRRSETQTEHSQILSTIIIKNHFMRALK